MNNAEELVEQIRNGSGDRQELLRLLYDGNRGLIYRTVRPYISGGMEEQDAMQEAFLGLLEAVERYDPSRGSFAACLCLWVRAVVGRWHSRTKDAKRIPEYMRSRIRKFQILCRDYQTQSGRDPTDQEILSGLKITTDQLQDLREFIRERDPLSLSDPVSGVDDLTMCDCIPDPLVDVEQDIIERVDAERDAERLWEAVDALGQDQAEILRLRYIEQQSMRQTGERLGLKKEKVRGQEEKALRKLKHNKEIRQIGKSRGYGSVVYRGGLGWFLSTGTSVVEEVALRRLEPDEQQ